ncbi:hypothetical protein Asp14428_17400 [Actinoplanes sp. NBRC 14428]|nr:hypothetical protein Asp14428_17400 [Actinoplanes sp. NBRC 14428]
MSGPTVMPGYWGGPRRTGPYRTGDLGRRDGDGLLHYLGRRDDLAKVRGHRVEPGEIEAVLGEHDDVDRAAVLVAGSGPDARIHAVVRPRDGRGPGLAELRSFCAERLPLYMLIDELHVVDALPVNANGKLDRARLAAHVHPGGAR